MNASVGYLSYIKNKKDGLPYLYKATQITTSTAAKETLLYESIGSFYLDEARRLTKEAVDLAAQIKAKPDATQDEIKAANDQIDAKNALAFGYSERSLDAYARAYNVASAPAARTALKTKFSTIYTFRFDKPDGMDAWIASAITKPFPNPTTEVVPVKIETTTPGAQAAIVVPSSGVGAANGTGVGAANGRGIGGATGTGIGAANGTGVGGAKPATTTTTTTKPATPPVKKPGVASKKSAAVKKTVAKKVG